MISTDAVFRLPLVRSYAGPVFRQTVFDTPLGDCYWRVAPAVHRRRRHRSPAHVDPPVDPFERARVDPARITRFTGREFPVWSDRWNDFGRLPDGDWDLRDRPPVDPSYSGPDPSLYLADEFDETPLHRALEARFVDCAAWDDLEFIREVKRRAAASDGYVWHRCTSPAEIRHRCQRLDDLYRSMRVDGCLSMRAVNERDDRRRTFREVMENEVLIDVGRDGEPRFVSGRHRLSLAKILDLDRVPVAVVARHPRFVADPPRSGPTVGEPIDDA